MGIAAYNRGSRAISDYITQQSREQRSAPYNKLGFERDVESTFQSLIENNEGRRARGLPTFLPSYQLAENIVRISRGLKPIEHHI